MSTDGDPGRQRPARRETVEVVVEEFVDGERCRRRPHLRQALVTVERLAARSGSLGRCHEPSLGHLGLLPRQRIATEIPWPSAATTDENRVGSG